MRSLARWTAGAFACAVLLTLVIANLPSGRPWLVDSLGIQPGQDKVGHFWVMGLFSAALVIATRGVRVGRQGRLGGLWVLLAAVVLVSLDEALQMVIPGRAATWSDLGASLAGIAVLGVASLLVCKLIERRVDGWRSRERGVG